MVLEGETPHNSRKFSDNSTGYLVCSKCNGYYKLQGNESPDDFEKCECGSSLTYHESMALSEGTLKFSSTHPGSDLIKSEEVKNLDHLKKPDTIHSTTPNKSENEFIMNRFEKHDSVSDEVLTTLRQDKGDLWDNLDELSSKKGHDHQKIVTDDVIEVNRLMMMVDEKRALEENNSPSKLKSASRRMGPIGFLGAAIVLLITVLILTLAGEIV
ncbi:MAG: hypothetical protein HY802_09650 [Methanobacterium sp.]|nr:hypothetical protein [Methanobacterium sp.]